ncbi:GRB2 [Mytilus edulis]|uniref:GRB2 n=1 Tax=Mytilus edulis TaxID=6550 RepID=A0A8S3SFZ9_MYTED|nr:GRB2 [Mytilus edulis]
MPAIQKKICKSCGQFSKIENNKCTQCGAEYADKGVNKSKTFDASPFVKKLGGGDKKSGNVHSFIKFVYSHHDTSDERHIVNNNIVQGNPRTQDEYVEAKCDYDTDGVDDFKINRGDIITVINRRSDGIIDGKIGYLEVTFPKTVVKPYKSQKYSQYPTIQVREQKSEVKSRKRKTITWKAYQLEHTLKSSVDVQSSAVNEEMEEVWTNRLDFHFNAISDASIPAAAPVTVVHEMVQNRTDLTVRSDEQEPPQNKPKKKTADDVYSLQCQVLERKLIKTNLQIQLYERLHSKLDDNLTTGLLSFLEQ